MSGERRGGGGGEGGGGLWTQERGSVRCSEVGTELRGEESAVTRLQDGHTDMFFYGVMLFFVNLISNRQIY